MKPLTAPLFCFCLLTGLDVSAQDTATEISTAETSTESADEVCREIIQRTGSPQTSAQAFEELKTKGKTICAWADSLPGSVYVQYAAGLSCMANNDSEVAIGYLKRAWELSDHAPDVALQYSLALKLQWRPLEGIKLLEQTSRKHPSTILRFAIAQYQAQVQQYKQALPVFQSMMAPTPQGVSRQQAKDLAVVRLSAGECLLYMGRHKEALAYLESANELLPDAVGVLQILAEAHIKTGSNEVAQRELDGIMKINPKVPRALYWQAVLLEKQDPEKSKSLYEKAFALGQQGLKINSDNGYDHYLLAQIADKLNQTAEAEKFRQQAKRLNFTYEAPWQP